MISPKILIGVPALTAPAFETTVSLLNLRDECHFNSAVRLKKATYIHTARNQFVYDAVDMGADYLMFIDGDMQFKPHAFNNMVERAIRKDWDITGGLYVSRYNEKINIIKNIITPKNDLPYLQDIREVPTMNEPFEVDVIGTGFLLIKMRVFQKLEPPFFYYSNPPDFGMKDVPFPDNFMGEDVVFCLNARKAGFKIYCDPTIELGHVGERIYKHPKYGAPEKPEGIIE